MVVAVVMHVRGRGVWKGREERKLSRREGEKNVAVSLLPHPVPLFSFTLSIAHSGPLTCASPRQLLPCHQLIPACVREDMEKVSG